MGKRRPNRYLSISQVAERVGVSISCLRYYILRGSIQPPVAHYGCSRYYLPSDVPVIREFIRNRRLCGRSRWTREDVRRMRELWEGGLKQSEIAEEFGTSQPVVSALLIGRTTLHDGPKTNWKPRRRNNG